MKKEIVKYSNDLHNLNIKPLDTAAKQNLFFALLTQFRDTENTELKLPYSKIYELMGLKDQKNMVYKKAVLHVMREISMAKYEFSIRNEHEESDGIIMAFIKLKAKHTEKILYAHINPEFKETYLMNQLKKFTKYQLAEFVEISGKYEKTIYRYLRQFESEGKWFVKYDSFKELLNIPESYQSSDIDKQILKPAIKQLSKYFKSLKVQKVKKGRKIDLLVFTYKKRGETKLTTDEMIETIKTYQNIPFFYSDCVYKADKFYFDKNNETIYFEAINKDNKSSTRFPIEKECFSFEELIEFMEIHKF